MPQTSKSEKEKPFTEKLKSWFKVNSRSGFPCPQDVELVLQQDTLHDLDIDQPLPVRLRVLKELQSQVREKKLQQYGVHLLWTKVEDLLSPMVDSETRHIVMSFLVDLVLGQFNSLDMMRPILFRFLKSHTLTEDLPQRIRLVGALTEDGKDIVHVEDEIGKFLLGLLDQLIKNNLPCTEFLILVNNMIKYNSAYLDPDVVVGLIESLSKLSCNSTLDNEISRCLETFNSLVVYSSVPPNALNHLIACLCRVVNLREVTGDAWSTMRNLMCTHLGHSALYALCQMVHQQGNDTDVALVRGAVFFIGMSLWGSQRVQSLKYSSMTVLPTFMTALKVDHQLVTYEVTLQVERLVVRHGGELRAPGWEEAVNLLLQLVSHLEQCDATLRTTLQQHLQNAVAKLEELAMSAQYPASQTRLYDLVEVSSTFCSEKSVLNLIDYRANNLYPAKPGWVAQLAGLVDKFYTADSRQKVRLRLLSVLRQIVLPNLLVYEDQLLDKAVLPALSCPETESDSEVRVESVQTVAVLAAAASGKHVTDLLDVLDKVLRRLGEGQATTADTAVLYTRSDFDYIKEGVLGMIQVFKTKLYQQPSSIAKRCFRSLITALDNIYERPAVAEHTVDIRIAIFRCLLSLRANSDYHLGLPTELDRDKYIFSPFIACEDHVDNPKSPGAEGRPVEPTRVAVMSLTRACLTVINCLKEEKDWSVLQMVLTEVPVVLQNKGMFKRYGKSISMFANKCCDLAEGKTKLGPQAKDLHQVVFPVLAALASYSKWMESKMQQRLIMSFEYGLLSRGSSNQVCIVALTACILEMSSSMYRLLPDVLLNLSKLTATAVIATPVLEFLSTLISLPKVFSSFNTDQYMSVFAITLPYTNPFKFNHYIVSLAHHVIIMWFLKCRLTSRREFVKFIAKGLNSNVLKPFEEGNFRKRDSQELASLNQDSSGRQRSTSLKEKSQEGPRKRHGTGVVSRPTITNSALEKPGPDEKQLLMTFHKELTETCLDLMARYSFANCSVQSRRSPIAEYLLKDGTSCTWLIGSVLVTITVSGCGQTASREGLCDMCCLLCSTTTTGSGTGAVAGMTGSAASPATLRKRHSSDFGVVRERPPVPDLKSLQSRDDIEIRQKKPFQLGEGGQQAGRGDLCSCCCQGWCEVLVRRPSGVTSWMCRVQNGCLTSDEELPIPDITGLIATDRDDVFVGDDDGDVLNVGSPDRTSLANLEEAEKSSLEQVELRPKSRQSCDPIPEMEEDPHTPTGKRLGPRHSIELPGCTPVSPPSLGMRGRADTMPPLHPRPLGLPGLVQQSATEKQDKSTGISPQFMFLQLYHAVGLPGSYTEKPLLLQNTSSVKSSLKILDRISCHETHKVGVLYVGPGQADDERAILSNQFGSVRYAGFLAGLGSLLDLSEVDKATVYLGGLDHKDGDGRFAYVWQDDVMQVVFHAATLMPNLPGDPQFNKKKRHIGNDFVAIVYNESGMPYKMGTVKGQFIYAIIVVEPLDFESNKISVSFKPELAHHLAHLAAGKIVSEKNVAMIVRQIALHCNLAANIFRAQKKEPYASNWLERLRYIKRMKNKMLQQLLKDTESTSSDQLTDFTGYV